PAERIDAGYRPRRAASRICLAIGAAAVPPNPAPTSMTATATVGCCAGAKATNHASASLGFVEFGRSSAVPVLPATSTPGMAAASRSWEGGEIVLGFAAGMLGCSPHPKARAVATRRRAPSLAPSGANTELHDFVNASVKEPPHASPEAFRSLTPDKVA